MKRQTAPYACLIRAAILSGLIALPVSTTAAGPDDARLEGLALPAMPVNERPARRAVAAGRAYAIDGCRFYYEGIPVLVNSLASRPGLRNDHARQRLQRVLDVGEVTLDGRTDPSSGFLRADVWVDGRTVLDWLDGIPPSASLSD